MDKIEKLLAKISKKDRSQLLAVLSKVAHDDFEGVDVQKLRGYESLFRIRKGKYRILLLKESSEWRVISIERRSDTTYRF